MATTPRGRAAEVASDAARLQKLEEQLDPEMQFRPLTPRAGWLVAGLLLALSSFHYYTAGFGLLPEATHRGVHLSFVLGLIFLVFPWRRGRSTESLRASLLKPHPQIQNMRATPDELRDLTAYILSLRGK